MPVRPRFQKAFLAWLQRSQSRLALKPRVVGRNDRCIILTFDGIHQSMLCQVYRFSSVPGDYRIAVYFDESARLEPVRVRLPFKVKEIGVHRGFNLYSGDADIQASPRGGYILSGFPDIDRTFPSREAIWSAELFEPFARWIQVKLSSAQHVAIGWNKIMVARGITQLPYPSRGETIDLASGHYETHNEAMDMEVLWVRKARLAREGDEVDTSEWQLERLVTLSIAGESSVESGNTRVRRRHPT